MNVDAVIGTDAVDGLQFRALFCVQLVVGSAVDDGAFQFRALEGSACDRDDGASAVLGIIYAVCFANGDLQL